MKDYAKDMDKLVVKKVFIDTYNRVLSYITFKQGNGVHDDRDFPLPCMQDNTYAYMLFFYEWIIEGEWAIDLSDSELESCEKEEWEVM